jgi:hypothetical protein
MRAGGGLSIENITQAAMKAGFPPDKAAIMAAITMPESSGDINAYNPKDPHGGSFGIAQINGVHPGARDTMGNLDLSMQKAFEISKGGADFTPWSGYTSGAYRSYLPIGGTGQGRTAPSTASTVPQARGDLDAADQRKLGAQQQGPLAWRQAADAQELADPAGRRFDPTGGQQMVQAGPQTATDAGPAMTDAQAGKQLDQMIPPTVHRKMSLDALVRQVAKIPGISDDVRAKLVEDRIKLLAPQEAEYAREYFDTQRAQRTEALADKRQEGMETRAAKREDAITARAEAADKRKWGDPVKMDGPDGPQYVQVNKATGEIRPVQVPKGAELTKIGSKASAPMDEADAKYWAQVIAQGGSLPTGLRRSGVVEQVMKLVPGLAQGMTPGDFIAKHSEVKANTTSLTNLTKMADSAISFEKLAEKNFDVALRLAPNAVPTDLGPFFNKWVEQGETALGDPTVPPYVAAIITGANEYAKVMSGSTGTAASTVDARREARDLFSPYLSLPQISQVIAVAKADMKNRENTLTEQVGQIKQRLGSSTPVTVAPPATPRATGQESQNTPPGTQPAQAGTAQEGQTGTTPDGKKWVYRAGKWEQLQ